MKKIVDDFSIIIGGDFFPGRSAEHNLNTAPESIWGDAIEVLKLCDLRIINLEAPITDLPVGITKTGPCLKLPESVIDCLNIAEIDIVTLANNHIYDYGIKGLENTIDCCEHAGIDTVGAHFDKVKVSNICYRKLAGNNIAILNFAENEWANASQSRAGANPLNIVDNVHDIHIANKNADIVIVIIHGGHENYKYPSLRMKKQYRFYAEQGADVVVGHHTHCYSGYETYKDVPIFYSLGNLFFPSSINMDAWFEGFFLKLSFSKELNNFSFSLIPYKQCENNSSFILLMKGNDLSIFNNEITKLNDIINDDEKLLIEWKAFVKREFDSVFQIGIPNILLGRIFKKIKIPYSFMNKVHLKHVLNKFRCEAHRDVALEILTDIIVNNK